MDKRSERRKWLIRVGAAVAVVLCLCSGCQKDQSRVYKVSYTGPGVNRSDPSNVNGQGPNNAWVTPETFVPQAQNGWTNDSMPLPRAGEYHLGAGDILKIKIDQLLNLDREEVLQVEVDRRGQIYLPLLNHVQAAGLTCEQLRSEISLRLGQEFIRDPKVDVNVEEYGSKKVMVLGLVRTPGAIVMNTDCTPLMDVISRAGGISGVAGEHIEILRNGSNQNQMLAGNGGSPQIELIPVSYLFAQDGQRANPLIFPGDVVKIPNSDDGYIYVSGEVAQAGAKPFRDPMTILQAVSSAGGVSEIADEQKCKIIRRLANGSEQVIMVNLEDVKKSKQKNIMMARNDTILLPVHPVKKFFNDINKLVNRGVNVGADVTYDAGREMGIPSRNYGTY